MTSLLSLFTEAFIAEQKQYYVRYTSSVAKRGCDVMDLSNKQMVCHGTRADCERFVVDCCVRKAFEALRDHLDSEGSSSFFIDMLATEPETASDGGA